MTLDDWSPLPALAESAALAAPAPRACIAVSGADRASYLQGLLTNDIQALTPGTGCYALWLTPQGRMTTDMHVLESGDMILLDLPAAVGDAVRRRLEQFVFTEDVQIGDLTPALSVVGVHGGRAAQVVEQVVDGMTDLASWAEYRNARSTFAGAPVVVARVDQLGVPGFHLYVSRDQEAALRDALAAGGALPMSADAMTAARVEAGYPLFGIDMDEDVIPLEAGVEHRGISFNKGCYVGQEVIIRVLHRGHGRVARKLVGLRFDGGVPAVKGARLHADGREIGFVTSSATSPTLGAIALGYVHRDFIEPGSRVEAETNAGMQPATVSALPIRRAA